MDANVVVTWVPLNSLASLALEVNTSIALNLDEGVIDRTLLCRVLDSVNVTFNRFRDAAVVASESQQATSD